MPALTVIGSANVDLVARVPRLPLPGETLLGSDFLHALGGKGANQAVAAARLGAQVTLVARVGEDSYGEACRQAYQAAGVATDYLQTTPGQPTGIALIPVADDGENHVIVIPGANAHLTPDDVEAAVPAIEASDGVLLQLEIPLETVQKAVNLAHFAGKPIILNPAPYRLLPPGLLEKIAVLTPNTSEAEHLIGDILADDQLLAQQLTLLGIHQAVVTLGSKGCLVVENGQYERLPPLKVVPVDTTGAGDAFSAGLAVALAEGQPLRQAAIFAGAVAGLATTQLGAQPAMPYRAEVERALKAT
jgi:ribokinase